MMMITLFNVFNHSIFNAISFIASQLTMIFLPLLALLLSRNVRAQVTFVPQAAIPVAVRSPYLNCWFENGNAAIFWPPVILRFVIPEYLAGREILIQVLCVRS
jgi:hypothetical protein